MSKFQRPMLNDDVCRPRTDKQTHKHTHTHTHKHTYRVKTEETFFYGQIFYFLFFLLYLFESIKRRFPIIAAAMLKLTADFHKNKTYGSINRRFMKSS